MGKRLQITPQIAASLAKCYGAPIANPSDYAVFEAIAVNTQPLLRATGFFQSATITPDTVLALAATVNASPIPLQSMHDGCESLPVGRVFAASTRLDASGSPELLLQFFVANTEPKLIADLEQGAIDEVSIGFMPKSATCSTCGFDYLGNEADYMNFMSLTCPDGHEIGVDGMHVNLTGVKSFDELSLVGKGAARGTKILPAASSVQPYALAATANGPRTHSLRLSCGIKGTSMTTKIPEVELAAPPVPSFAEVLTLSQNYGELTANHKITTAENVSLKAQIVALEAQVVELTALKTQIADMTGLKASHEVALTHLKDSYKAVSVALGNLNPTVPDDVTALLSGLKAAGPNLALIYREGGIASLQGSITDAEKPIQGISTSFRVPPSHR